MCHLFHWRPEPEKALDAAWSAAERMLEIDALDDLHASEAYRKRVAVSLACRAVADARASALGEKPHAH